MSTPEQDRVPIVLLKEGATETKGKDARKNSITAAKLIAKVIRSGLGPRGMDKMLVDPTGDVTITNDGATILKEIEIEHPVAKMIVEVAKSVDNEAGDGTKSVVVFAGSLIENAEELLDKDVHPTIVVEGFREASKKAIEFLKDISIEINPKDKIFLNKIAKTTIATKLVTTNSELLSTIVVDASLRVADELGENKFKIDLDDVKVEKKSGGSLQDSQLIQGMVIDKEVVHAGMPKRIQTAKIALINSALEIEKTESDAKLNITSPEQMQKFLSEEERMLKSMVDNVVSSGANVVLCQKGIDDVAQHYLAKEGIIAVRRIKESDMAKLAKATGAKIITNTEELSKDDIGHADLIEERNVEDDKWVFIEGCKNPKSITILIRGSSQRVVDEAERSIHDALMVIKDAVEYPYVVVGGGAPEVVVSKKLREWSSSLASRQQLAVEKYADALESIPLTLAENAGMSLVDAQAELRTKSQTTGKPRFGVDVFKGKIVDLSSRDVYEPLSVKNQVINSGTEAACMILRIDDIISAGAPKGGSNPPGGGSYGGMPE
ncbi:MAG: thermosome subunit [Thaumarchaeota archaeon]|nr:MAG: thermosome subunit [Nitrososphaerota archaeon]